MSFDPPRKASLKEQAGFAVRPVNLAKTLASQVPFLSGAVEVANQLAGLDVDRRLGALEVELSVRGQLSETEVEREKKTEATSVRHGWPAAVSEFLHRIVTIGVIYDGGEKAGDRRRKELVLPFAQACMIDEKRFITCGEAQRLARDVARAKSGKLVMLIGMAFYDFSFDEVHAATGLITGTLGERDEAKWKTVVGMGLSRGVEDFEERLASAPVKYSLRPLIGEECGFIHPGEAKDVMRLGSQYDRVQFDTFVISHFRKPTTESLIAFVSGVLPGRVLQCGSPIFTREGVLLGVLADTESYESDAGRRAVVLGLLTHPAFPETQMQS